MDRIVGNDPFVDISWPRKVTPKPDPFTAEERDRILDYFWRKKRHYYPFVYTMFFVGLRPSEAIALRWGCVDLRSGMLTIEKSRSYGEDNPTKTARAERTIRARDEVIDELRAVHKLRVTEDSFVFTSEGAHPIDEDRFAENHWHPTLRACEVRPRSFYKTRHTFISLSLESGKVRNIKALADYCGTSVEMIEKHYAGRMPASSAEELAGLGGAAPATPRRLKRAS